MNHVPAPRRSRRPFAWAIVGALAALALLYGILAVSGGPVAAAAPAVTMTFVAVTQDAPVTEPNCANPPPLPAGAGSASVTTTTPSSTITTSWSVPAQITAGATATLRLQVQANPGQLASGYMVIKGPFEFGAAPGPFELNAAVAPGGSYDQSLNITFTPTRAFTPGESLFLIIGNGCTGYRYEYKAIGTAPAKPAAPKLTPRSVRPVPGVTTSYASPRRGKIVALPFPKSGCAPPATTTAREAATPAGGECSVDIFLRRKDGETIDDPDVTFGTDLEVSDENIDKGYHVCKILSFSGGDDFLVRARSLARCVLVVARILQRDEDLRRRRGQTPLEHTAHAARRCRSETVRLKGAPRRAAPVRATCAHKAKGLRITLRSARKGKTVGALIKPSSKLIIGRSSAAPFRPGDRVDVLWTVTPPPTTTRTRVPAPLPGAPAPAAAATAKLALTSVEAFPNQRTSSDPPANAIDANTGTFTWSTEAYNVTHPSYLAVGFAEANVGRLRLWKERNGGGGELIKNLTIQYTTGTGPLSSRTWANVSGLANGVGGAEPLKATAVSPAGTVTGDVHDSPAGDGYASLTFTPVRATGLRIAFANPNPNTTCSAVSGTCNHYRVGELEAYAVP